MLFKRSYGVKQLDVKPNYSNVPSVRSAKLIYVNGAGRLRHEYHYRERKTDAFCHHERIVLNGVPLIQILSTGCATCSSLLSTGWGIENADCPEFVQIKDQINDDFTNLEDAIENLTPLLTLLKSGLYMIADVQCFPTDGDERFFWSVPNKLVEQPATAMQYMPEMDNYSCVGDQPVFVYPTQSADRYCEERVQHYMNRFRMTGSRPRAIVYRVGEFMNMILDGHHKACAAARLGEALDCIQIIPCSVIVGEPYLHQKGIVPAQYWFGSAWVASSDLPIRCRRKALNWKMKRTNMRRTQGRLVGREWESDYLNSAKGYPNVAEYAKMIELGIRWEDEISDEQITRLFLDWTYMNQERINLILKLMERRGDHRLKQTAVACIKQEQTDERILLEAYRALCKVKEDEEVEQIFIEYLVDHRDKSDSILREIDLYWRK